MKSSQQFSDSVELAKQELQELRDAKMVINQGSDHQREVVDKEKLLQFLQYHCVNKNDTILIFLKDNYLSLLEEMNFRGETLLDLACQNECLDTIKWLLQNKINNIFSKCYLSFLPRLAALNGQISVLECFREVDPKTLFCILEDDRFYYRYFTRLDCKREKSNEVEEFHKLERVLHYLLKHGLGIGKDFSWLAEDYPEVVDTFVRATSGAVLIDATLPAGDYREAICTLKELKFALIGLLPMYKNSLLAIVGYYLEKKSHSVQYLELLSNIKQLITNVPSSLLTLTKLSILKNKQVFTQDSLQSLPYPLNEEFAVACALEDPTKTRKMHLS